MNRIEKLIQEYCPEGVELIKLGELVKVLRGRRLTKSLLSENEKFPVYHGGLEPLGYYGQYNRESNSVMVINVGASAGTVGYSHVDFWSSDGCFCIEHSDLLLSRFIYYALFSQENIIKSQVRFAGVPTLDASVVENIKIPIPPLPVQQEIVNILDKFTQLEEELNAELEARRKQYDFYLNQLMGFEDKEVEWKIIGEIAELKAGKSISAINISDTEDEEFKFKCIGGNGIRGYVKEFSNYGDYPIIGRQGALCGNLFYATGKFYATEHAVVVMSKGLHNHRFLYYLLNYMNLNQYSTGGAQPGLAVRTLNKILIPIPSLSEQERIVSILDKFDALVNDSKIGIQAEIEARRKQYAYYRNKLLTFGEYA
jgi:type I restriction enzyme S subunit